MATSRKLWTWVTFVAAGCGGQIDDGEATHFVDCKTDVDCMLEEICHAPDGGDQKRCVSPEEAGLFVDSVQQTSIDKLDLLFMIDNSPSMADKQAILEEEIPDLVQRLVNPVCVNSDTGEQTAPPGNVDAACPAPFARQFYPIRDVHIGVVSSSLGSYGTAACAPDPTRNDPLHDEEQDDGGRMVGASMRAQMLGLADTVDGTPGFVVWDVRDGRQQRITDLQSTFQSLTVLAGERGCSYESSLEAWYRFLVDPAPPARFVTVPCPSGGDCIEPQGVDENLLAQRRAFLRPDSLLAIVMVTDENDCSMQGNGQLFYGVRDEPLPASSSVCAMNPNDECCYSCAVATPNECDPDPLCSSAAGNLPFFPPEGDPPNLRCWQQKRRFGVEFLYPVSRYVNALTEKEICPSRADLSSEQCPKLERNPIFSDLSGTGEQVRTADLVYLAGIVGVPWQDIAADVDPRGNPWPPRDPDGDGMVDNLRFFDGRQMRDSNIWANILGSPEASPPVLPNDPLMIESVLERTGVQPATGAALASASSSVRYVNPVNGHERTIVDEADLQYACIFDLPEPRYCPDEDARGAACACGGAFREFGIQGSPNDPVCQDNEGNYGETQYAAKAYPSPRILEVLRDFGDNGIVGSICPANTTRPDLPSFGYRPAIGALVDRLGERVLGHCVAPDLALATQPDGTTRATCTIVEAVPDGARGCDRPGRRALGPGAIDAAIGRLEAQRRCGEDGQLPCDANDWTVCAIEESTADENGDGHTDCIQDIPQPGEVGWCYVDPAEGIGDAQLVERCPPEEQRLLRFVDRDADTPTKGATVLITCELTDGG